MKDKTKIVLNKLPELKYVLNLFSGFMQWLTRKQWNRKKKDDIMAILQGLLRKNERGYRLKANHFSSDRDPWKLYLMFLSREINIKLCTKIYIYSILYRNSRFKEIIHQIWNQSENEDIPEKPNCNLDFLQLQWNPYNNEYIGRIYQMLSWQFFNEFYTIFQYLRK